MNARLMLGHSASSRVLETSYDEGRERIDVTSATVGEDSEPLERMIKIASTR